MRTANQTIKTIISGICVLLLAGTLQFSFAQSDDPAVLIEQTVNALLAEFIEHKDELEGNNAALFELLDKITGPVFDFDYISKLVLARNWKDASDEQRQIFSRELKRLMIVTYATALFRYTGEENMVIIDTTHKEKQGRRFATVKTGVKITGSEVIPVNYFMIQNQETPWKIYNMTVAGFNMVLNYREVFQSMVHSNGLAETLITLKENNDRNSST